MPRPVTEPAIMDALDRFASTVNDGNMADFLQRHDVYPAELKAAALACASGADLFGKPSAHGVFVLGFCIALDLLEHGYLA